MELSPLQREVVRAALADYIWQRQSRLNRMAPVVSFDHPMLDELRGDVRIAEQLYEELLGCSTTG